jgi:His-Xaa-Ser system protein HxsD
MPETQPKSFIVADDGAVRFEINVGLYSLGAVKKAAYKFTSECAVLLEQGQDTLLTVVLNFVGDQTGERKLQIAAALCNEILDQDLREIIAKETESTRNLILAHAFSKTSLTSQQ